jgi:hypothetical protein
MPRHWRLKPQLEKQNPPSRVNVNRISQSAKADFVWVAAISIARANAAPLAVETAARKTKPAVAG